MVTCNSVLDCLFSYETPKIVHIKNRFVGILSRLVQLAILGYIIGYVLIFNKGYQEFSDIESAVTTKVKGVIYTNFSDDQFKKEVENPELYRRIWDVADYVVPPSENGAVFVATNVLITSKQKQGTCVEDPTLPGAACDPESNNCTAGSSLPGGNGVMTGECKRVNESDEHVDESDKHVNITHVCVIEAWCPVEIDVNPLKNETALLAESKHFTLLIKNFVNFPKFKDSSRRNIRDTSNGTYLSSCHFDSNTAVDCPVFVLGDMVKDAGQDYDEMAVKGGVIAITIKWDCNFDFDKKYCFPTYTFRRLDDPSAKLAPGLNFRYANYYNDTHRTLYKAYGIKFVVIVQGQGRRFSFVPLLLNVGAGLGLLALQVVICDLVVLYLLKRRDYFRSKKYEEVNSDEDSAVFTHIETQTSSVLKTPSFEEGYQRFQ